MCLLQPRQRVLGAAHHGQVLQLLEDGAVGHVLGAWAQRELGVLLGARVELVGGQEQHLGRQGRALGVALHQAEALLGVLPKALEGRLQVAMHHHGGIGAQVVEHGGRFVEEQRQVVLDAGRGNALAHVLVDAAARGIALQQLAPAVAELGARVLVHGELAAGQQAHLGHGVEAALGVGVEGADGVDLVVEQIHAVGLQRAHGKQVDQAAAHRVLAVADHLGDMLVAGQRQLSLEFGLVQLLAALELEGVAGQEGGRCQPVQRRGGGHQHHVGTMLLVALVDAPQRGQALADQVLVGREAVVGQGLPVGEQRAAQARCEEGHLVDQPLGIRGIGRDDGRHPACSLLALAQAGQQQGVGAAHGAGQGEAFSGSELGQFHGAWTLAPQRLGEVTTKPLGTRRGVSNHFSQHAWRPFRHARMSMVAHGRHYNAPP